MNDKEKEFLKKLLAAFKQEATEHLKAITDGLLELEKASGAQTRAALIESMFREAHSLKGAARAVNLSGIEAVCRALESIFHNWQKHKSDPAAGDFDILHQSLEAIRLSLSTPEKGQARIDGLLDQLDLLASVKPETRPAGDSAGVEEKLPESVAETAKEPKAGKSIKPGKPPRVPVPAKGEIPPEADHPPAKEEPALQETVRIPAAALDSLLLQAQELSQIKLGLEHYAARLRETAEMLEPWKKHWSQAAPQVNLLRQAVEKAEAGYSFSGLLEYLEWNSDNLKNLEGRLNELERLVGQERRSVGGKLDNLLADLKSALMFPAASLLQIFPMIVRELSRDQGKEVDLVLRGGEVEIDRRIMEELKEPLIHLVRNSLDHGIEKPALRVKNNKPPRGRLTLAISQVKSSQIEILVSDDGAGIDLEKVKKAAVRLGIITEKESRQLGYQETLALIFESNVSTSSIITDISGRGLGLTIVREKVEKLSGSVSVETTANAGAAFRMLLPITLASFRGVLVQVGDQIYAVPSSKILQSVRIKKAEIKTVENRETISLNGHAVPLVPLAAVLELTRREEREEDSQYVTALVLGQAEKLVAFSVDQLLNEQEILLKSLGGQLQRVRNIAGATLLGSGRVVPVLNVPDLLKSAGRVSVSPAKAPVSAPEEKERRKSILVVEDSITARMLLKNILESAGYTIKTAVDGLDGFTQLRTADFDLVVSDVDMPRLNGFGLTAKIRGDRQLAQLPVVLVTALESRADRERGIDAGANAYIVKSTFDQSNLLEVIQRLL